MAISQKWKDTVNRGIDDARWDEYDDLIKKEVDGLNRRLAVTPQFHKLDWLFIKAMLWTESGGPDNASWKKRVMQIGNPGDPAYQLMKDGKEGSALIMESTLHNDLKTLIDNPEVNIRAAIAYLYTRLAKFESKSIPDPNDKTINEYKVIKGDSLSAIASKVGTTVEELYALNPAAKVMIKPGQALKYRKAKMGLTIVGWRIANTWEIANRYNGGGDPNYSGKLNYLLTAVFPKLKRGQK
jgi:LysM repeat protein